MSASGWSFLSRCDPERTQKGYRFTGSSFFLSCAGDSHSENCCAQTGAVVKVSYMGYNAALGAVLRDRREGRWGAVGESAVWVE
jgi:hypothetical protein